MAQITTEKTTGISDRLPPRNIEASNPHVPTAHRRRIHLVIVAPLEEGLISTS
jgi:hypothetical protein